MRSESAYRWLIPWLFPLLAGFQIYNLKSEPKNPSPAEKPRYLLMLRYWGTVTREVGDSATLDQDWVVLTETYKSLDEVKARISGHYGFDEKSIVGLWDLSKAPELRVKTWTTEKIISEHVEERKETVRHWAIEH